ncbi:alpha/beta fold hydrolase [Burkholderia plantarii]|uniref:alpha/beta fold hydrolase n=1 Tax=Burkholderia plantarii TaxID=41899 RepID=UPI001F5B2BDB|nr:alpha/beta fold hydrolase [Burkholderia plantarii]
MARSETEAPARHAHAPAARLPFVLVHGAWHGAWAYQRLGAALATRGHPSLARDLPAHGLDARYPAAFGDVADTAALAREPSPVSAITLDDYTDSVLRTIDEARALGHERVVLVGHSMGGLAITAAAEHAPERIAKLVYLAAFMPASGAAGLDYVRAPENQGEALAALMCASPRAVGALRINPASRDAGYLAMLRQALFEDVDDATFRAAIRLMSSDLPPAPFAAPISTTPQRWGSIERHYVTCANDRVLLPALQQRFIAEADAFVPQRPTRVHRLESSHSPYLSQPEALAEQLVAIARAADEPAAGFE